MSELIDSMRKKKLIADVSQEELQTMRMKGIESNWKGASILKEISRDVCINRVMII